MIDRLTTTVANPYYPLLPGTSIAAPTMGLNQLLLPFPQFTSMTSTTNQGYSWYHAAQFRLERRFASGFSAQLSYTLSKQMEAMTYLNADDPTPYRTISPNDRTHHVGLTAVYELPFGSKRRLFSGAPKPVSLLISGWQISAIMNQWSGNPLSFGDVIFKGDGRDISDRESEGWSAGSIPRCSKRRGAAVLLSSLRRPSVLLRGAFRRFCTSGTCRC